MRRPVDRRSKRSGFTLMEVLLVLAIIGVILAMVVPQLMGRRKVANVQATYASIKSLEQALELYQLDHNDKPDIWSWGIDQQDGTDDDIGNWMPPPQ